MTFKLYSRPRDRSLEAFKDWMQGMTLRNSEAPVEIKLWIDDRQWVDNWTKFWERVDQSRKSGEA